MRFGRFGKAQRILAAITLLKVMDTVWLVVVKPA